MYRTIRRKRIAIVVNITRCSFGVDGGTFHKFVIKSNMRPEFNLYVHQTEDINADGKWKKQPLLEVTCPAFYRGTWHILTARLRFPLDRLDFSAALFSHFLVQCDGGFRPRANKDTHYFPHSGCIEDPRRPLVADVNWDIYVRLPFFSWPHSSSTISGVRLLKHIMHKNLKYYVEFYLNYI